MTLSAIVWTYCDTEGVWIFWDVASSGEAAVAVGTDSFGLHPVVTPHAEAVTHVRGKDNQTVWEKRFNSSEPDPAYFGKAVATNSTGAIFASALYGLGGPIELFPLDSNLSRWITNLSDDYGAIATWKYTPNGSLIWDTLYDPINAVAPSGLALDGRGRLLVAGTSFDATSQDYHPLVVRYENI